jgi:hypothetical protein
MLQTFADHWPAILALVLYFGAWYVDLRIQLIDHQRELDALDLGD